MTVTTTRPAAAPAALDPGAVFGSALSGGPAVVRYADGRLTPLDVPRWTSITVDGDAGLLARCTGRTLDVGCGPGRLLRALVEAGVPCAGVDVVAEAVALARTSGAPVLHASVFDAPLEPGAWDVVLLADGNLGIGGDPVALLRRSRALLSARGCVVVELDPPATPTGPVRVRLEHGPTVSAWFPWAHVAADDADALAREAGLEVVEAWQESGRWFARLAAQAAAGTAAAA